MEKRLQELGITLPEAAAAVANYVPFVVTGNMVHISGQLPHINGDEKYVGKVGHEIDLDRAVHAARDCGINILAQLKQACDGDLTRVVRCVKLGGFVNATDGFKDHPKIINGASDLMVEVMGEKGRHARFAVGASSLPKNVPVEIDAIFEIK